LELLPTANDFLFNVTNLQVVFFFNLGGGEKKTLILNHLHLLVNGYPTRFCKVDSFTQMSVCAFNNA
jgi:hypothetical protein